MLMDNSGVTGGIISSGNEQQVDVKAPTMNGFEQLRPEDVAGSFDAYVNSGAVLAPNIETPKVELGPAPEMMPQFPNSAELVNKTWTKKAGRKVIVRKQKKMRARNAWRKKRSAKKNTRLCRQILGRWKVCKLRVMRIKFQLPT